MGMHIQEVGTQQSKLRWLTTLNLANKGKMPLLEWGKIGPQCTYTVHFSFGCFSFDVIACVGKGRE